MKKGYRFNASGFTLVELLVVIAIITVLSTLVVAVARTALLRAKEAQCMSNLRSIGVALQAYADDNGGSYPQTSHTAALDQAWIVALEPYLGKYDEARICPADPRAKERLAAGGTSYVLNSFVFVPKTNAWGKVTGPALNRPSAIPYPSQTILAFVCADSVGIGAGNDHTHSAQWNRWSAVCADIAPARFGGNGKPTDVDGRANYLYADGHVESIPAALMKEKTDAGTNIAQVPGIL
jgi:prepilin-type N-terminal cleavage/methylation domain-containing protein/prepilin-type processing-associated H-X9-DG protein